MGDWSFANSLQIWASSDQQQKNQQNIFQNEICICSISAPSWHNLRRISAWQELAIGNGQLSSDRTLILFPNPMESTRADKDLNLIDPQEQCIRRASIHRESSSKQKVLHKMDRLYGAGEWRRRALSLILEHMCDQMLRMTEIHDFLSREIHRSQGSRETDSHIAVLVLTHAVG